MKIILKTAILLLWSAALFAQISNPNTGALVCCEKNLLKNGELNNSCSGNMNNTCMPPWEVNSGTPQASPLMGYATPGYAMMWGTTTPNESIKQTVSFQNGYRYQLSCAIRKPKPSATEKDGIRFQFFVGSTKVAETFELFYTTTSDWVYVTLPEWTSNVTGPQIFSIGPVSGTKDVAAFGHIDDICLQELPPCDKLWATSILGPTTICEGSGVSYSVPAVSGATYSWSIVPSVPFTGNGTNAINIPGTSTMGKTQLAITLKVRCGGKEVLKTLTVKILKKISDPDFGLIAVQNSGGYGATGTPVVGADYQHHWILYEANSPIAGCNFPLPAGSIVKSTQTTHTFSQTGLTTGKYYMLRHYVRNCDGTWLSKNKCFNVVAAAKVKPGTNELPVTLNEGALKTISPEQFEAEVLEAELKGGN
jgi:PKD-like domain